MLAIPFALRGLGYFLMPWIPGQLIANAHILFFQVANTVEQELFNALTKTCLVPSREESNFSRCGRTDRGVHALGNYVRLLYLS